MAAEGFCVICCWFMILIPNFRSRCVQMLNQPLMILFNPFKCVLAQAAITASICSFPYKNLME